MCVVQGGRRAGKMPMVDYILNQRTQEEWRILGADAPEACRRLLRKLFDEAVERRREGKL